MSEEDFRSRLLAELAEEEPPPLGGLVADALGDGLRRRRRRRFAQVLGSAAGVTAVAVAATAVARTGAGGAGTSAASGPTVPIAAAPSATVGTRTATTLGPDPSATPATGKSSAALPAQPPGGAASSTDAVKHWQPVPSWMTGGSPSAPADGVPADGKAVAAVMVDDLGKLGGGPVTHLSGSGSPAGPNAYGAMADGFWNLSTVGLRIFPAANAQPMTCDWVTASSICDDYKLADGTQVEYFYIPGHPNGTDIKDGKIQANMVITRPDGTQLVIIALNGREQGLYGPDRSNLPLTEQQLWGIISDPRLGTVMDRAFVQQADKTVVLNPTDY